MSVKALDVEHGIVCRRPDERFGYFGWPTVARMADGALLVVSSGLRSAHICPWGKTVLNASTDEGRTWSPPRVIQNSPIDDRDAGIVDLGGGRLLVSWFTSDTRRYADDDWLSRAERASWSDVFDDWSDALVTRHLGSWIMLSADRGANWSAPVRVPVSAPHGPIRRRAGDLIYLGKRYHSWEDMGESLIAAARSTDGGRSWEELGTIPLHPHTAAVNYHEPHVVELPSGRLIGTVRIQDHKEKDLRPAGIPSFSMMQSESDDGGYTWSPARSLGFHGSPPHLMRHTSGVLLLTYGYRKLPYGQRVAFSYDRGASWDHGWIIRDDGPDSDLGYPSTVELADGGLLTVYYQKAAAGESCSLLYSRWRLPR